MTNVLPVDVEIPGCPPTPTMLLQGILAAITNYAKAEVIADAAPPDADSN